MGPNNTFDFNLIKNGTIIRLNNDVIRDWVCIHHSNCDMSLRLKHNKNNKNHTGYYLFGGLWYDNESSYLTSGAYGKCIERLERGMFPNIQIVGDINNKYDYNVYKNQGRL